MGRIRNNLSEINDKRKCLNVALRNKGSTNTFAFIYLKYLMNFKIIRLSFIFYFLIFKNEINKNNLKNKNLITKLRFVCSNKYENESDNM